MSNQKYIKELKEEIDKIKIIDAHEHIRKHEDLNKEGANFYTITKYGGFLTDLIISGMPPNLYNKSNKPKNTKEMWNRMGPYIENIYNTGYYRGLMVAFRDLYEFDSKEITKDNFEILNDRIIEAYKNKDWYKIVLKDKLNIELSFLDAYWEPAYVETDKRFFVPSLGMDPFVYLKSKKYISTNAPIYFSPKDWWLTDPLQNIMKSWDITFRTFNEYIDFIDLALNKVKENGGYTIKLRIAYNRGLKIDQVSKEEARNIFYKKDEDITAEEAKKFEDFIVRVVIKKATERNFPVQVHTGMQGITGNPPDRGHPFQLINLFNEFPSTKFVLFHASYPFVNECTSLIRSYPNVYLDICWLSWLLLENLNKYISEWLAMLPCNKIIVSGDTECVERTYSAIFFLKKCFVEVLAEHTKKGYYSIRTAKMIARKIFRENAINLYNMEKFK